jgi:DHA1 family multidrug/chloramphenicol efflux transport protein-like MFS transporter
MYLFPIFFVLFEFTVYLSNDMIMPGMIHVIHEFSVDNSYVPVSLTYFLLGGASLQILLGPVSDSIGRRKTLLFGNTSYLIATLFIIQANSIHEFLLGRFFQGMGLCYIGTIGYASIQEMYEERQAIRLISMMSMIALLAPLVGPLLGGIYSQYYPWRGIFIIIAILASISFIGLFLFMPETAHLRLSSSNKPEKYPNLSHLPKLNIRNLFQNYLLILKNKKFLIGAIGLSLTSSPLIAWIAVSPVILIKKAHLSAAIYGACQIPIFGAIMIGNLILQKIVKKSDLKKIILSGTLIIVIGLMMCGLLPIILGQNYIWLVIALTIYCFGLAISNATMTRLVLYSSNVAKGTVSAMYSMISTGSLAISTFCISLIYKSQNNIYFGIFCTCIGFIILPLCLQFIKNTNTNNIHNN